MNKHGGYNGNNKKIIDYSININPFGVSELLKKNIKNKINDISKYPEIDCNKLKVKLSKYLDIDKENLIIGNGATELIYLFLKAMKIKSKNIGILEPTFTEYRKASQLNGAIIFGFREIKDIIKSLKKKT